MASGYARALNSPSGTGTISPELELASFLEALHWTWEDYLNAPVWLIDTLRVKMEEDTIHQRREGDKARRNSKHGKR